MIAGFRHSAATLELRGLSPFARALAEDLASGFVAALGRDLAECSDVVLIAAPGPLSLDDSLAQMGTLEALHRLGKRVTLQQTTDAAALAGSHEHSARHGAVLISTSSIAADPRTGGLEGLQDALGQLPHKPVVVLCRAALSDDFEVSPSLARAMSAHGRVIVRVCDARSESIARRHLGGVVELVPDPTFMLRPGVPGAASIDAVAVFGMDGAASLPADLLDALVDADLSIRVVDGRNVEASSFGRWFDALRGRGRASLQEADAAAQWRRAQRSLGIGEVVLTDSFPLAVLACLMGKPVVALEDSAGGLRERVRTWLSDWPMLRCAASASDAIFQLQRLHGAVR